MSFLIRKGDEKDVQGILRLIKELAEFERAPEAVINTEKMLLQDGFGENPLYKTFIAEDATTNEVIGMALYYTAYSTWKGRILYIDDLIVTQSYRRNNIGTLLINHVLQEALDMGVNMVKWQVLDWNTPAIEFYKKMDAEFDGGWVDVKMSKQQITKYIKHG